MRQLTLLEGFESTVRRYPDRTAVVTPEGRSVTYDELSTRSAALAAALEARIPGERCAVLSRNRLAVVEAMLAAARRGRANVQLATRGAVGELESSMAAADAAGLIYEAALSDTAGELVDRTAPELTLGIDGAGADESYEDALAAAEPGDAPDAPATDPPESATFFTSGTTSAPKGILVDQEQAWLAAMQPALEMSLQASDRALVCGPWYHMVTSEAWMLPHLMVGATLVVQPEFDPEASLRALDDYDITGLLAVPTQLEALLEAQEDHWVDLGSLDYIRTGGAIVPESLIDRCRETFDAAIYNTYGLTEGVGNLTFAYPEEQADHPGTIGKSSFLWELRVVEAADPPAKPDPTATVTPGELGEIIGRSLQMTDGYLDRPEATEALFIDDPAGGDAWLRTGDVARVDEDRYPVIVDRIDNMIVSGGENVYPAEVERALEGHPGVREAAVVGVPDETWGEMVAAAVVAADGTAEELEAYCVDHDELADFKRPRQYRFVDELPRTATGTLQRGEVLEWFDAMPT
ncbi:MAG: class I adenylate-forming enzyme family protein [Halobacteriales archaeon]